jgi:hypothetical protein
MEHRAISFLWLFLGYGRGMVSFEPSLRRKKQDESELFHL